MLNTTIDRYAYAFIEASDDGRMHFVAPDVELAESFAVPAGAAPDDLFAGAKLALHAGVVRGLTRRYGVAVQPWRVTSFVDAPPGSGLGSSSALVVALVEACAAAMSLPLGPYDVAHLAYEIERVDLGLAGGKQDQYAATFGGINFIEFLGGDRVIVNPAAHPGGDAERAADLAGDLLHGRVAPIGDDHRRAAKASRRALAGSDRQHAPAQGRRAGDEGRTAAGRYRTYGDGPEPLLDREEAHGQRDLHGRHRPSLCRKHGARRARRQSVGRGRWRVHDVHRATRAACRRDPRAQAGRRRCRRGRPHAERR